MKSFVSKKVCSLCGSRVESSKCTNSLCRDFEKHPTSRPFNTNGPDRPTANSPINSSADVSNSNVPLAEPFDSPQGTTIPRHIAGVLDNLLAWFFSVACANLLTPESGPWIQLTVAVLAYLSYFFVFEALFCTTPAKFMNGLVVRNFAGGRCTLRQTFIRTLFRLVEVNPALLGALPAAAFILWTKNKQRLGDIVAGTVVVMR